MFAAESLDFVDIITDVHTHVPLVQLAAKHHVPAICQKPLAMSYEAAAGLEEACQTAGVPLLVHENWRWQTPIRQFKLPRSDQRAAGRPFRARIDMVSGFPVFRNQPALAELDRFILTDMGVHILDVALFLFGEAASLYCTTHRVHEAIRGEDVATVVLLCGGATVVCNMGYAENYLERQCFPEYGNLDIRGSQPRLARTGPWILDSRHDVRRDDRTPVSAARLRVGEPRLRRGPKCPRRVQRQLARGYSHGRGPLKPPCTTT